MTQVFAAMNHRLSEEYAAIELPNQDAKDTYVKYETDRLNILINQMNVSRLLADAKYLHQKFGALKNAGTPSTMLETVVSEKSVAHKPIAVTPKPVVSSTNERLKGLLYRRESSQFSPDKVLPTPTPPPHSPSPANGTPPVGGGLNGENVIGTPSIGSPSRPSTPRVEPKPGFKQVAVPTTPEVPPSPALPITPDVKVRPLDPATELLPPIRPPRTSSLEGKFVGGLDSSHGLAQVTSVDPTSAK